MATTTNFGWETPDDTDLVKDGAAAIRTLGQSIDTSLMDLEGGTTGQVLSKASNTDMDFTWTSNGQTGPAFAAYKASTQTGISSETWTKVTYDTERFDTDTDFDSSRFTPTKAGYYQINALNWIQRTTTSGFGYTAVYKNGTRYNTSFNGFGGTNGNTGSNADLIYMNGTTDYLEVYCWISGEGASVEGGAANSSFSGVWIRG